MAWIAVGPSLLSVAFGAVTIALLGWIWASALVARRVGGGDALQLVATREGISSPLWSLRWDRVQSISIGESPAGGRRALFIDPIQPADVQLPPSRILRLNRLLSRWTEDGRITILEGNIDRPIEQLMLDLERQARRELTLSRASD